MGENQFIKGIITLSINMEVVNRVLKVSNISSNSRINEIIDNYRQKSEYFLRDVENFKNYIKTNADLIESWENLLGESKILFVNMGVDHYIIYRDVDDNQMRLGIFWRSDKDIATIINEGSIFLKDFFKRVKRENKIKSKSFIKDMITEETQIRYYPFFKKSFKNDEDVDVSNLGIKINKISLERKQIITHVLLIVFTFLLFLVIPREVKISTVLTALISLIIYIGVNYWQKEKIKIEVKIISLTFNENINLDDVVTDEKSDELNRINLDSNEEINK